MTQKDKFYNKMPFFLKILPYINFKKLNKETLETKNKFNKLKLEFYNREKINYDQIIR